ncbi:hypothetical protein CsSME_00043124 [Camellia sinensis var. sinensis]
MGTTSSVLVMLFALFFIERLEFICSSTNSNVSCIASEREALMKFKGNLTDEANRLSSWVGKDCCTWKGVGCSNKIGHVVKLDLHNPIQDPTDPNFYMNRLGGQISPSLLDLNHLHYLDLSMNNINNDLSGPILDTLGRLTSLIVLDLSINNFNDSMLYSLCNLTSLVHIDLIVNSLGGAIPHCLGNLASLSILRLSYNDLKGPIPSEMGNMTQLTKLDLSLNAFQGEIPNSMWNLCNLRVLDLSDNIFTGKISTSLGQLSKLEYLDLSNNALVLNVISQWVPPFQLQVIQLSSIKVGAQFPQWLKTQKNVTKLYMSNASISDIIPDWFESICCGIIHFDLSNNQIKGKVPIFQKCKYRYSGDKELLLSSNRFEGPLTLPSDVYFLDLFNNLLSGPITVGDDNATMSPVFLVLSNNHLTGVIPVSLCKAKDIAGIDFSNNQLVGKIPPCLGQLDQLSVLDLTNNSLYGEIPSSLGSLQSLNSLHLRNNKFYGKLPLSLQNLTNLLTIDLGENVFTDNIPPWIGYNLTDLKFLNLQSNNFYGDIPPQLCHLQNLQLLNLAQNNIMGNIPRCFGNFTAMVAPERGNFFGPTSYNYFGQNYEDNILDSMKGRELEYTKKALEFLVSMDLSNNSIVGEIPEELMDLFGLLNLNLSGNHLKGRIPNNIGNLTQLESLDLSRNKLSGPIPPSLSSLSYLSHLNMSFNNLSGRIPTRNQLRTLDDPFIYIGNDGLCGAPLNSYLNDKSSNGDHIHADESKVADETDFLWFYTGIGPGFLVGFLGVCGTLNFKKSWRYAYFQFIENNYNWISVTIANKFARLRRKFNKGKFGR